MKNRAERKIFIPVLFTLLLIIHRDGSAQNVEQQLRLAKELEHSEQWEEAKAVYETLHAQAPDRIDVFTSYKEFCLRTKDFERALELILDWQKRQPDDGKLLISKAEIHARMGNREEAVRQWEKAVDRNPNDLAAYAEVAASMTRERYFNEAETVYLLGRKRLGNATLFALNLANLYAAQIEYGKAASELIVHLLLYPGQASFIESHLYKYPRTKRIYRQVAEEFEKAIRANPDNPDLRIVLIDYHLHGEAYEEALREALSLETLEVPSKQGKTLFEFGQKAFRAGAARYAESAYLNILENCPQFAQKDRVLEGLAQSYKAQDKLDRAVETYRLLSREYPKSALSRQALYQIALIQKDRLFHFSDAEQTFRFIIKKWPDSPESIDSELQLGECLIADGKLDEAGQLFQKTVEREEEKHSPLWIRALVSRSEVFYFMGDFDKAVSELDRLSAKTVMEDGAQEPRLNDGLGLRVFLKAHYKTNRESLTLFSRSQYLVKQRKLNDASAVLDSLIAGKPEDVLIPYTLNQRGELAIEMNLMKTGLASFDTLLARFPGHILADRALERSGWIMEKEGNKKEAFLRYERLLTEYPHSLLKEEVRERIRRLEKEVKL
jgi:tetratricopeptide (TPR) repeat protein